MRHQFKRYWRAFKFLLLADEDTLDAIEEFRHNLREWDALGPWRSTIIADMRQKKFAHENFDAVQRGEELPGSVNPDWYCGKEE
jgi:hypothetical protein